jgi:hypothetical protein
MNKYGPDETPRAKQLLWRAAGMFVALFLLFLAGSFPNFIEDYYTTSFYRCISFFMHLLLAWVPFSLGDIFYTVIVLLTIIRVAQVLKKIIRRQFRQAGLGALKLLIGLQLFIAAFYLFWGMNYFRPPAAKILNLQTNGYTFIQLQVVTRLLIDSTNANRALITFTEETENNSTIYKNAVTAIEQLGAQNNSLKSIYPAVKPAMFTPIINYMGTAGYFNPFSSEAQINYNMPVVNRPVTACHEMAHQMGFAREDEANFIGFLAGKNSADRLLKYSAYYMATQEFMHQVYSRDSVTYKLLKAKLSPVVRNDIKNENEYWEHYQNQLGNLSGLFYDKFLKMNNQPEGLRTYNRMINLTMAYYEKAALTGKN